MEEQIKALIEKYEGRLSQLEKLAHPGMFTTFAEPLDNEIILLRGFIADLQKLIEPPF